VDIETDTPCLCFGRIFLGRTSRQLQTGSFFCKLELFHEPVVKGLTAGSFQLLGLDLIISTPHIHGGTYARL